MNKKKKITIISVVCIVTVTLFGSAFVISGTACSSFSKRSEHFGPHHSGMPPFDREAIKEFILWRLDKAAAELNLAVNQQKSWDTFKESLQNSFEEGLQKRNKFKALARSQMSQDQIDLEILTKEAQQQIQSASKMLNTNLSLFNAFYSSLDPAQKAQVGSKIKEKINSHRHHYYSNDDER